MEVPYKTERTLTTQPSNHTPWYLLEGGGNLSPHKNQLMSVSGSLIRSCQNLEASPSAGDGYSVVMTDNGKVFSTKKK